MADDHRYDWLDDDAVERLLTPAQSPSAGPEAELRLAALLRSLAPEPARPDHALPGEEAALAAFRTARAERTREAHAFAEEAAPVVALGEHVSPARQDAPGVGHGLAAASSGSAHGPVPGAVPSAGAPTPIADGASSPVARPLAHAAGATPTTRVNHPEPDPVVRIGMAEKARGLFGRWRPVKVALAMTVAGCALGGVAVAAGTGVLSTPFGRAASEPETSASVSALDDTGMETPLPPSGGPSASPSPGKDGHSRASGAPHAPAPSGGATAGHGGKEDRPGDAPSASPSHDAGQDRDGDADATKGGAAWAARLCRDFLDAQQRRGQDVDEHDLRDLERFTGAGSADALREYCERHTADGGKGVVGGGDDKGGSDNKGGGKGGDDGKGDGRSGRSAPLVPSVLGTSPLLLSKALPDALAAPLRPLV
ncbi:hypothetical protein ACFY1P_27685 [Streptomyces sp. NPDC001407]|uniref:hypothetical protein n=1 Tax=unclassified Streptomyces TaxID=2593676 RepID=UPI0033CAED87